MMGGNGKLAILISYYKNHESTVQKVKEIVKDI
jgi:hypothetical protein